MLAALMGDGKKSIFYKNFVKSEKAIQASVSHPCRELAGEFHFTVLTFPDWQEDQGIYFNNIEADIRNTIAEWEEKGFTDEDLEMVKAEMISQSVDMKTSLSTKASMISQWEWLVGESIMYLLKLIDIKMLQEVTLCVFLISILKIEKQL